VGDKCIIMPNRTQVEVTNIYYEDIERDSCVCGENVRLKLTNIEEEEISPGFMICDAEQEPCGVGRVFDAQVAIIEHKLIICPGYTAVLRIHATAVEVQLKKLITLIDRKTGERTQKHPRFIKQNQVAIARFELTQSSQTICMEPFKRFPQLGRFTLRDEGRTVVVGKVLKIVDYLLTLKTRNDNLQYRIHIEPRLTPQNIADIESVCSLDYTSSYINWSIVKTTNDKNQFQVKQWNSLEVNLDRKYNFIKAFNQLSDSLSKLPLNDADVLLVEQSIYRYPNLKLATYISQIQQIRAILNTLLHCHSKSKRSVYHISGRDVALHFGLFVDDQLKMNYHRTSKGQREPMAQCLLRALAFLQCVNEKKDFSLSKQ
ncbi:unnamed protein product, partial [Rotaria sp. Silwood1]